MKQKLSLLFLICFLSALNINATVYTGSCGTNVRYSLDTNTGVLKITGTGEMEYYRNKYDVPWYSNKEYIKVVEISDGVTSIGDYAFYGCSGLTSVTIPNSVTSIGLGAFSSCFGLTSVTIPNSVTSIGSWAFSYCSGLTSIEIPNSVTSIEYYAFYECSGLTSVTIGNSVTSIEDCAFYNCSKLTSVTIPNSVTSIGYSAFYNCSKLTSVTIPNSVTSIGEGAFSGCTGLTSITIPNSVTSIGSGAFYKCSGLTSITIGSGVTSIGNSAFYGCSGLTSVTIPNSVTSIGGYAFDGVDIPTVVSLIENPFTITGKTSDSRTFTQNTFNNATLYVPKGTIEKYKATDGWKDFVFMEEGEGPGGDTPETQKCATPTIALVNGKCVLNCETEDVKYICNIEFENNGNVISLPSKVKLSVYATKDSLEQSDRMVLETSPKVLLETFGDMNGDGEVNMSDVMFIVQKILNGKFPDE